VFLNCLHVGFVVIGPYIQPECHECIGHMQQGDHTPTVCETWSPHLNHPWQAASDCLETALPPWARLPILWHSTSHWSYNFRV